MKAKGSTAKHSKSAKHADSAKHKPAPKNAAMSAAAKAKAQAAAQAAAKAHVHAVGKQQQHAKAAKWSPAADVACCSIEALAASLRIAGHRVGDTDVLELYFRAVEDPDAGLTLPAAFAAAAEHGLAGVRLLDARPAAHIGNGTVIGVDLEQRHALVADGHGVWTWGAWRPASCSLLAAADEAWELTWQ